MSGGRPSRTRTSQDVFGGTARREGGAHAACGALRLNGGGKPPDLKQRQPMAVRICARDRYRMAETADPVIPAAGRSIEPGPVCRTRPRAVKFFRQGASL